MKNFVRAHTAGVLWLTGILGAALCGTAVFLFLTFRADGIREQRREEAAVLLYEAELEQMMRRLEESLTAAEGVQAYHYAASAAEHSAGAGHPEESVYFGTLAGMLLRGEDGAVSESLRVYRSTGRIPPDVRPVRPPEEEKNVPAAAEAAEEEQTERYLAQFFGPHHPLRRSMKTRSGEWVYTGRNAYAVLDARTGQPLEAAVSFPPVRPENIRLPAGACVQHAKQFLEDFFPPDVAGCAVVYACTEQAGTGTADVVLDSRGKRFFLTVRRDTGRVVRVVAR